MLLPDTVRTFLRLQVFVLGVGFWPQESAPPQQKLHNLQVATFYCQMQGG